MFDMELEFKSEDELAKVPEGTEAVVQVRAEKDRELGDFRKGESQYGPWMSIPFEVVEGPFKGTYASMMLSIDPESRKFRRVFEIATGVDISEGGRASMAEFVEGLVGGRFQAVLGPEKKNPKYTRVVRLNERVGERAEEAASAAGTDNEAPAVDDVHDEDIPF